jgi:O-acetyl-ADP-ribose deacetylase (regulator of RNase III)
MNIIQRSRLKRVEFTFAAGDLFDAGVDAIVSSEQTDFILSRHPESLSGQIWSRYGAAIQQELDAATNGHVLRAGTVLDTSGGQDFLRIFHAGFHEPHDWPGVPGGSRDADYFEGIGSCIAQVLDAAVAQKLTSVAFPLIGCGLFGLDEKMLVLQFLDTIEALDNRLREGESIHVWLVIRERAQFESVTGVFLDLLLQARSKMVTLQLERSGVPILDRFAARLLQRSNEDWAKWQLCRYAELAVEFMCYGLSRATRAATTPESLFEEGLAPTFGRFRSEAQRLADAPTMDGNSWGARFFAHVVRHEAAARALETINTERNNLAHGRQSLPLAELKKLVSQGLMLESWESIPETNGELRLVDWQPWLRARSTMTDQIGLFERWQKNALRYLVPETGEIFKVPRSSALRADNVRATEVARRDPAKVSSAGLL